MIIVALFAGICAGIVTGLIPGVHINLVAVLAVSFSPVLLRYTSPLGLAVFIIAMSITHTFLDSIPSIFLGAPDADTALAVLPGHQLLLDGRGFEAVKLTVIGSLLCLLLGVLIVPILLFIVPFVYNAIDDFIGWILVVFVFFVLIRERKLWAVAIFLISGVLGMIVLGFPNLSQPLFPMLSGLFGVSGLLISLNAKTTLPFQTVSNDIQLKPGDYASSLSAATISGWLTSMFPGLGAAQAAVLCGVFFKNITSYTYLVLVGGINTVNFLLSIVTFYTINKARNGSIVAVQQIIETISFQNVVLFLVVALIVGGIATILALLLARGFSWVVEKMNYRFVCVSIILLITIMTIVLSGLIGLVVLITSTALGMLPPMLGVGRNHAMGCLLLPVILFFLL